MSSPFFFVFVFNFFLSLAQTGLENGGDFNAGTHTQYVLSTINIEGNLRLQTNGTGEHKVKVYAVR
jgi:hypothetical protein